MPKVLISKQNLSTKEKLAFFRSLIRFEMEVLNEYCSVKNLPKKYAIELCHLHNVKKINIARLLSIVEFYEPDFIKTLALTDPRVRKFIGYYFEFLSVNPYRHEVLEPQNLFGNWDFIKYKLRILFPELTLEEIDKIQV